MDPQELVRVYTVRDVNMGEVIRVALEDAGIACRLVGGGGQFDLSGITNIDVMVHASDAAAARDLIQSHSVDHSPSDEEIAEQMENEPDEPEEGLALDEGDA